jgi:hypothetical protein
MGDADFNMALALRCSRFSFSSAAMRCLSSVVTPGRWPASMSARSTQLRSVCSPIPNWAGNPRDHAPALTGFFDGLFDHPDGPFSHLRRIPLRRGALLHFHDSNFPKVWSLQESQDDSFTTHRSPVEGALTHPYLSYWHIARGPRRRGERAGGDLTNACSPRIVSSRLDASLVTVKEH